jgi:LysR family hydrogen peroxide-inducible transcriptional activator
MELRQLEHFLAVVEEGTFTRAAERVSLTQPAVSLSIKKLEEEIGGALFAEGRARPVPYRGRTSAGRLRAPHDSAARRRHSRDGAARVDGRRIAENRGT